jgi:N-acetylglutamate synthase-like GNAT family acetyltransferase
MILIRLAQQQDVPVLTDILRSASLANSGDRLFLEAHPEVMSIDLGHLESGRIHVAEKYGQAVGFATILQPESGVAEIDGVFVTPRYWGHQIGTSLLNACCRRAKAEGATQIHVMANPHALDFYSAIGFVPSASERPEVASGLAFSMRRPV